MTVGTVVATHNLALGGLAGALLSAIFFARRVAHLFEVFSVLGFDGLIRVHAVSGELFIASTNELMHAFDYTARPTGSDPVCSRESTPAIGCSRCYG
ncbi:hypothetical protein AB0M48_32685 [Lentzea sp. NPDC051208]|uniref:hypothetical protein n=1 Tax=Lentzea sp. NPDC051208 TaxID=3154642 RepID=UPI0034213BF7